MKTGSKWIAAALVAGAACAQAADIAVVGLFPGKAVLIVDGGAPKTYAAGARIADGVKLVAVDPAGATVETRGRRETIPLGSQVGGARTSGSETVVLSADERGHFLARGQINGSAVQMLVDTGATLIALPASEATRLGIDYRKGQMGMVSTANGQAAMYRIKLDTVKVGDIELHQVDALVQETGLPVTLLGMSFLNRTSMQRDGAQMTLRKRY
ncbi:MAG: retropepsin-like aspartic protease family protein [Burkholderiaceae bacterium]